MAASPAPSPGTDPLVVEGGPPGDSTHLQATGPGTSNMGSGSVGWGRMGDTSTMTSGTLGAAAGMDAGYLAGAGGGHELAPASPHPLSAGEALAEPDRARIVHALQALVAASKDGEHAFEQCASHAQREALRERFREQAAQYGHDADELQAQIRQLGGHVPTHGSVMASVHRGWAATQAIVHWQDEQALLAEALRDADQALARWREALAMALPDPIRQLLQTQCERLQRHREALASLRETSPPQA